MKQIPWISLVVAALVLFNPIGLEVLHNAFLSGEALSRNIAMPIFLIAIAVLSAVAFVELWIRWRISR